MKRVLILCLLCLVAGCLPGEEDPNLSGAESYMEPIAPRGGKSLPMVFDKVQTAHAGDILMVLSNGTDYVEYEPSRSMVLSSPQGVDEVVLKPGERWQATHVYGDKSLLLKAPSSYSPRGYELALLVSKKGDVVGDKPWFDLKTRRRFIQTDWTAERRKMFRVGGVEPDMLVVYTLKYNGFVQCRESDGLCSGSFTDRMELNGKVRGTEPPNYVLSEGQRVIMNGVDFTIVSVSRTELKYVLKRI